jgi:dTDP-4-dehydrorhamnose 3,5-epimerase
MHYQAAPYSEAKLVRCTRGAVYDVIIDLRPHSNTFRQWSALQLSAENGKMVYIPEGCAHGFLTLKEDTELFYQISDFYNPDAGRGVRWNDPAFDISWPQAVNVISERDRTYPNFEAL